MDPTIFLGGSVIAAMIAGTVALLAPRCISAILRQSPRRSLMPGSTGSLTRIRRSADDLPAAFCIAVHGQLPNRAN